MDSSPGLQPGVRAYPKTGGVPYGKKVRATGIPSYELPWVHKCMWVPVNARPQAPSGALEFSPRLQPWEKWTPDGKPQRGVGTSFPAPLRGYVGHCVQSTAEAMG